MILFFLQVFVANRDVNSAVTSAVKPSVDTRLIRLVPVSWTGSICLRMELYGCPFGMPDKSVSLFNCQVKWLVIRELHDVSTTQFLENTIQHFRPISCWKNAFYSLASSLNFAF